MFSRFSTCRRACNLRVNLGLDPLSSEWKFVTPCQVDLESPKDQDRTGTLLRITLTVIRVRNNLSQTTRVIYNEQFDQTLKLLISAITVTRMNGEERKRKMKRKEKQAGHIPIRASSSRSSRASSDSLLSDLLLAFCSTFSFSFCSSFCFGVALADEEIAGVLTFSAPMKETDSKAKRTFSHQSTVTSYFSL